MTTTNEAEYDITLTLTQVRKILASGAMSAQELADVIDGAEAIEGCLVLDPGTWHADDGHNEVWYDYVESGREAAEAYVGEGDWGEITETTWISVATWREGIDSHGDDCRVNDECHKITLDPEEPECTKGGGHEWCSDHDLVGGITENPGVWGHGGGVVIHEACRRCGCGRITDTWAQDMTDGEQGLQSVSYEPDKYEMEQDDEIDE